MARQWHLTTLSSTFAEYGGIAFKVCIFRRTQPLNWDKANAMINVLIRCLTTDTFTCLISMCFVQSRKNSVLCKQ